MKKNVTINIHQLVGTINIHTAGNKITIEQKVQIEKEVVDALTKTINTAFTNGQ